MVLLVLLLLLVLRNSCLTAAAAGSSHRRGTNRRISTFTFGSSSTSTIPRSFSSRRKDQHSPFLFHDEKFLMDCRGGGEEEQENDEETPSSSEDPSVVTTTTTTVLSSEELEEALDWKQKGKELHSSKDYVEAAHAFGQAADALSSSDEELELYATCRLHQAQCLLQSQSHAQDCIDVCTFLLERLQLQRIPATVRARALFRRSKAYLQLAATSSNTKDCLLYTSPSPRD